MPLTENDLKDLLAERATIPATRAGRLSEVHRRIRRRNVAKTATGITAAATAVAVVALGAPVVANRLGGQDSNGLTVVGSPSATSRPSPPRGAHLLTHDPSSGKVTVKTVPPPDLPVHESFPPAEYTIKPEGDGYRVTIAQMGDLEGLRRDLRELGIPAVESPSPGFGDCPVDDPDPDSFGGAVVTSPGVWEFTTSQRQFDADRELGISNDPNMQVIGMLLYQHWCRAN